MHVGGCGSMFIMYIALYIACAQHIQCTLDFCSYGCTLIFHMVNTATVSMCNVVCALFTSLARAGAIVHYLLKVAM